MQPAARAGPILRVAIAAGKFQGRDQDGNADRLMVNEDIVRPGGSAAGIRPECGFASSAYQRKNSAA